MGETNVSRLLEDIRSAPDDDAPRLVWADAVGGERGELVVIQCELARETLPIRDAVVLRRRQKQLLAQHGDEWAGLRGLAGRVTFHRGFVDAAEIPVQTFLRSGDEIFEAAPLLSSVTFTDFVDLISPIPALAKLLADPAFLKLRGADLHTLMSGTTYVQANHGDEAIALVVQSGALRRLRGIGIFNSGFGENSVRMLVGVRSMQLVTHLALRDFLQGDAIVAMLQTSDFDSLRAIDLGNYFHMRDVAPLLPPTVVDLTMATLNDDALAALVESPAGARIERLTIERSDELLDFRRFAELPRLRALAIGPSPMRTGIVHSIGDLARLQMPALRELALAGHANEANTRLVAQHRGPQLQLLDLRGNQHALRLVNQLKDTVAGELLVGERPSRQDLMRVTPTIHMQWWDHVTL